MTKHTYHKEEYQLLEQDLAKWIGHSDVVVCNSGTAALHLAIESFQIPNPEKKEIICPDFSMIACPRSISLSGMTPVLVDCDQRGLMEPEWVEQAISKRTVAIMAVHNYGRTCQMQAIHDIAAKYDVFVIEDMAEAHGCHPHPQTHAACWSFYKNKVVHGEEGGAVCFREGGNEGKIARQLRSVGFNDPHDYTHIPRGHNYRMSNLHATSIRCSLANFRNELRNRRMVEAWYEEECPQAYRMPARESPWVYDFHVQGMSRGSQDRVIRELRCNGIQARHGFKPVTSQPEYQSCKRVGKERNAERLSQEIITLPIDPDRIDREQCKRTFRIIIGCL